MYTKAEYEEQYKRFNKLVKKDKIKTLMGYISTRLSKNTCLGYPVARFYYYQLSTTLWTILTGENEVFKHLCEEKGYVITVDTEEGECGDLYADITSPDAEREAKIWNNIFSQGGIENFYKIIMTRLFKEGQENNDKHPTYIIHKDSCSKTVWEFVSNEEFLEMVKNDGWDVEVGPESFPYIIIS